MKYIGTLNRQKSLLLAIYIAIFWNILEGKISLTYEHRANKLFENYIPLPKHSFYLNWKSSDNTDFSPSLFHSEGENHLE